MSTRSTNSHHQTPAVDQLHQVQATIGQPAVDGSQRQTPLAAPAADGSQRQSPSAPVASQHSLIYGQQLFQYAQRTRRQDRFYILTFGVLQRLNITHLHHELAQIKADVYSNQGASDGDLSRLRETLKDYGTGVGTLFVFPCSS